MKCMFKSLVTLVLVFCVLCSVCTAEGPEVNLQKPYLTYDEVVMLAQIIQEDLKIGEDNGNITFAAEEEASIYLYEEGYRLDEVFCAVDDAVAGNTFYTEHGMLKILKSLGYTDVVVEMMSDDNGEEFAVVKLDEHQEFKVYAIRNNEDLLLFKAMNFYDCIFFAIVGEEFVYEEE